MTAAPPQVEMMDTAGAPLPRTMTRTRPMDSALKLVDHYFLLPHWKYYIINLTNLVYIIFETTDWKHILMYGYFHTSNIWMVISNKIRSVAVFRHVKRLEEYIIFGHIVK